MFAYALSLIGQGQNQEQVQYHQLSRVQNDDYSTGPQNVDTVGQNGVDTRGLTIEVGESDFWRKSEEAEATTQETLEAEIAEALSKEKDVKDRLDALNREWSEKIKEIKMRLEACKELKETKEADLSEVKAHGPRPGPECLQWVEGKYFLVLCTVVIVVNVIMMIMELNNPILQKDWWFFDQLFLLFYVVELSLKALLMQRGLLLGRIVDVWWHWLDLIIVVSGVMDQWLAPGGLWIISLFTHQKHSHQHSATSFVSFLRLLRLARLARILKVVSVFLHYDLSWTEGYAFQMFIMSTIAVNSLLLGMETDVPSFPAWYYVEQVLLGIYTFEILVRLKRHGYKFFWHKTDTFWNWMDFVVVLGGVVEQWMMPLIGMIHNLLHTGGSGENQSMGQIMMMLRMARLLRILRLVRLIKAIPPLFTLMIGIMEALQGMTWVLVLTMVMLYAFAIVSTHLLKLLKGVNRELAESIFPSTLDAMFVFFLMMNGDQSTVEPLLLNMPGLKVFFVFFMVASSWAILSILTAVVSENMINVSERTVQEREEKKLKDDHYERITKLSQIFEEVDNNGSGDLDEREFSRLLLDPETAEKLCEMAQVTPLDLADLFNLLSRPQGGDELHRTIKYQDFIDGLERESHSMSMKAVMRIEKRIKELIHNQTEMSGSVEYMSGRIEELEIQGTSRQSVVLPTMRTMGSLESLGGVEPSANEEVQFSSQPSKRSEMFSSQPSKQSKI